MRRQYDYTVGPCRPTESCSVGVNLNGCGVDGRDWTNDHVFERGGDDNITYFTSTPDQVLVESGITGAAPWDARPTESNNFPTTATTGQSMVVVGPNRVATTFLCEETHNTHRLIALAPGATAKVFLDAWEHYQTVPLTVQVSAAPTTSGAPTANRAAAASYSWAFINYLPIGGAPCSGSGRARPCVNTINESPPIIQTMGHTDRTPKGESPVSEATKRQECCCARDRPYLLVSNTEPADQSMNNLMVSIKIAQ